MLNLINLFPVALILCGLWNYFRLGKQEVIDFNTPVGGVVFVLIAGTLAVELIKNSNVSPGAFLWDLFWALVTLIWGTYTMTKIDQFGPWVLSDYVIFGILFLDALGSPYLAFNNALRNLGYDPY